MSFLTNALKAGLGVLGGLLFKKPKAPALPPPTATRDDAAAKIAANDELLRRKGTAADMLTGTRGAEAAAGSAGKLVLGN